jgi:hypothetical protein
MMRMLAFLVFLFMAHSVVAQMSPSPDSKGRPGNLATTFGSQTLSNKTLANPIFTGTVAGAGTIPLSVLAPQAANTFLANITGGSASPTAIVAGTGNLAALQVNQGTNGAPIIGLIESDNDISIGGGLVSDTAGNNVAYGYHALFANTSGGYNTAVGTYALIANTTGSSNLAIGPYTLDANIGGYDNTAVGLYALHSNVSGNDNAADGIQALYLNTSGSYNSAVGVAALYSNTTGTSNFAAGYTAAYSNTTGSDNFALGGVSLYYNTTGSGNFSGGYNSLNTLGQAQTAGAFHVGTSYTIATVGTTDFTLIGAASNTVGVVFTASGVGTGTGTATPNGTNYNTVVGNGSGAGIIYGIDNSILGANVTSLAAGLSEAVIFATGQGTIRADFGNTTSAVWSFPYPVQSTGTAPTPSASGGTCAVGAATGGTNAGRFATTGACAATNTITLTWAAGAATKTGWACTLSDRTTRTAVILESSDSTTTAVFTDVVTTGTTDTLQYQCTGY